MTIRLKASLIILALSFIFTVGIFTFSRTFILKNVDYEEKRLIYEDIERTLKSLEGDINILKSTSLDWSEWDDTYYFVKGENPKYIDDNIMDDTFINLKINIFAIIDSSDKIIYSKGFDYETSKVIEIQKDLENMLNSSQSDILLQRNYDNAKSGLVYFMHKPMIIAATPISNGDKTSNIAGTLIIGRFVSEPIIKRARDITNSTISITTFDKKELNAYTPFDYRKSQKINIENNINVYTKVIDDSTAEGTTIIRDIYGNDTLLMKMKVYRIFYVEFIKNLKWFLGTFLFSTLVIHFTTLSVIKKFFIKRIEMINDFVNNMKATNNTSLRIDLEGNDELSNFAHGINLMLDSIEYAYTKIAENEERFRMVMDGSNDGFWNVQLSPYEVYLSKRLLEMIEYDDKYEINNSEIVQGLLVQDEVEEIKQLYENTLKGEVEFYKNEHKIITLKGNVRWFFIRGKVVEKDKEGKPLRISGIATDITETKQSHEEVEYLSFHDSLTGLYNRLYFINELERIDRSGQLPISIIMGDVNGLKLTNDAFGHSEGDRLLITIAEILKKSCRNTDIIGRLGGDEFVILLPATCESEAIKICNRIKVLCEESDFRPIRPSIALGVAAKIDLSESIHKLYEAAEERMYKNKLLESRSARHSIIALMEKTLYEMDCETEAHTERLYELSLRIGNLLNLSISDLDELRLLAKLHDIGKTAIPREILLKPQSLSDKEWSIMKQHTEIGYRMAMATPDLAPIAESILSHHEKWDGTGYPRGLKGKEIPLLARIITIVDAYDVITNPRPYKKAFSHDDAIAEIKRCSGTQFDPSLVKTFILIFEV